MGDLFGGTEVKTAKPVKASTGSKNYTNARKAYSNVKTAIPYQPINQSNINSLVGGSTYDQISGSNPTMFKGGGLGASYDPETGTVSINSGPRRAAAVGAVADNYGAQAADLIAQRGRVAPGFSEFRQSALQRLEDSRKRAISNLRDNFSRRGVMGSSFGEDAVARQEMEFNREAERINTEAYLKELEMDNQFSQQQYEASNQQFQTGLNELNLQADVAAKLSGQADNFLQQTNQILGNMATTEYQGQVSMAEADATNKLKSQIAQVEAKLARAQGQQRSDLQAAEAKLKTSLANMQNQQSVNNVQAQNDQATATGIGGLIGTGLSLFTA